MHSPNVHQVRENLADYLAAAERGEEVLICRRNQPVARLVALAPQRPTRPRPLGRAPDAGEPLPDSFFEPLPADLQGALTGNPGAADPLAAEPASPKPRARR